MTIILFQPFCLSVAYISDKNVLVLTFVYATICFPISISFKICFDFFEDIVSLCYPLQYVILPGNSNSLCSCWQGEVTVALALHLFFSFLKFINLLVTSVLTNAFPKIILCIIWICKSYYNLLHTVDLGKYFYYIFRQVNQYNFSWVLEFGMLRRK